MTRFVLRRLAQLPLLLLAVYTLAFALAWAVPGSPFDDAEGRRPSREAQAAMRAQYRLDDPAGFYLDYLGRASGVSWAMGRSDRPFDLGPSLRHPDRSVNEIIADGFPISMTIGILAMLIALAVGITTQCVYCIDSHSKAAVAAGATETELAETAWVATAIRAGGGYAHGRLAFKLSGAHEH